MILHFCHLPSDSVPFSYCGAGLEDWLPRLYPNLNWGTTASGDTDSTAFIWNVSALICLDRFEEFQRSLELIPLRGAEWLTGPDNLFWITRLENIKPFIQGNHLVSACRPAGDQTRPIPSASPLSLLSDPVKIHEAIRSFQYRHFSSKGVRIVDPTAFYIESLPEIGPGTRIHPGAVIEGRCEIGDRVDIGPNTHLVNSRIGTGSVILTGSLIYDSEIGENARIGPYAHLRAQTVIAENARIGNFVEVKKSSVGTGSKAMHLSYLGDATIGCGVNIGAGTITCNYDGVHKNPTHIGDHVFVGSGTELVAPVTLENHSFIAAGSTITESVPADALAVARTRQRVIPGWSQKRRKQ